MKLTTSSLTEEFSETAMEVQRNIVAQRILGLPRDRAERARRALTTPVRMSPG